MGERKTKTFSISSVEYMCVQSYEELKAALPQESIIYTSNCGRSHNNSYPYCNTLASAVHFPSMRVVNWFISRQCIQQKFTCLASLKEYNNLYFVAICPWQKCIENEEEPVTVIYRSLVSYSQGQSLICSDASCYFSFIFISRESWQLCGWWAKISFSNKCQSKKHEQVAFPVQTQHFKESLEDASSFLMSIPHTSIKFLDWIILRGVQWLCISTQRFM